MEKTADNSLPDRCESRGGENVFSALADSTRRRVLGILYERAPDRASPRELATALVPEYRADSDDSQLPDAVESVLVALHHNHLPRLERAGLIEQDPDRETVTTSNDPAFEDTGIVEVIRGNTDADADSLDTLFEMLAHARRRTILDVLSHQFGPVHTETLAREVGAKEQGTAEGAVSPEDVRQILVGLYHVHLPVLSTAGLVQYDSDEQTVAYKGHSELRVPWMHSVFEPDFRPSLTSDSEPSEIGTIHGRERVVSFGQSLCERAENELFCMFTQTDLLEAGCLTRLRDAANGGVDVYLGTRDETVREYVRDNAPEVVLWEPETSWLNLPVGGNNVGRLLLADREAVMLGTLRETDEEGSYDEQAIVGDGADNALVVMIAQLLRPVLDQSVDESDSIESQLPF